MYKNLAEIFLASREKFGSLPAFAYRRNSKNFQTISYKDLIDQAEYLALALLDLGVNPKDHIGIIADNRLEWIIADIAILMNGAADIPRGTDVTDGDINYIIPHADIEVLFIENNFVLEKINKNINNLPKLKTIIFMDGNIQSASKTSHMADLIEKGKNLKKQLLPKLYERINNISSDDLFTLIYTSGTTGAPKGVMLTHGNITSQIEYLPFHIEQKERILSILPIWHIFERVFEMIAISSGCCTYYSNIRNLKEDLSTVQPTFMASAPRLWESIYQGIIANVEKSPLINKFLFHLAYTVSKSYNSALRFLKFRELDLIGRNPILSFCKALYCFVILILLTLPNAILDVLVLSKIRKATGGKLRGSVSGGGALPLHIDEFFNNIGIPVLEGYGLTETCPVIAVRTFDSLIIGTVGRVYKNTEIRLIDINNGNCIYPGKNGLGRKGELHIRGPQVMKGYYKNQEATNKVYKDGWFNTGDLAILTYNNCIKIVGRSKETIVLLSGENVEPVPIENMLLQSEFIDQAILIGQDRKFLSALIIVNTSSFKEYGSSLESMNSNPEVLKIIQKEIKKLISTEQGFKSFEKVVDFRLLPKAFEVGDELTAKLSMKRHIITEKYDPLITDIYNI
ncbi:MAG: long-chain fatty acid--CoA ligase [Leptospira sp.]|nr:long-chain fatty acid--CoA ligase [Leptospira sp.]NCS95229.1 long-chain fatty acid--CoA ligase [Leptospira sp.]